MSDELVALALGTALAVGALAYVLYPLFFDTSARVVRDPGPTAGEESAIRALREIEFDRATGKLSDADYGELRAAYSVRALRELRADAPAAVAPATSFGVEERVKAYRASRRECARCGLRPEPDAIYCSTCGGYLAGSCPTCALPVTEASATFCSGCGTTLSVPQTA